MEKYITDDILEATDDLIDSILQSELYQQHVKIRQKLSQNKNVMAEIETIKKLEQQYVKENFQNEEILQLIEQKKQNLETIPLYKEYEQSLDEINRILVTIKDDLNQYFTDLCNKMD